MGVIVPSGWAEWDGTGFPSEFENSVIYYAYGELDLDDMFILRSLARTLKDDGVVDSLSEGIDLLEDAYVSNGTLVEIDEERFPFWGDEDEYDEEVMYTATWVEVRLDG